jgi:hypothetical protein
MCRVIGIEIEVPTHPAGQLGVMAAITTWNEVHFYGSLFADSVDATSAFLVPKEQSSQG